jgi:hypothetical protein
MVEVQDRRTRMTPIRLTIIIIFEDQRRAEEGEEE